MSRKCTLLLSGAVQSFIICCGGIRAPKKEEKQSAQLCQWGIIALDLREVGLARYYSVTRRI